MKNVIIYSRYAIERAEAHPRPHIIASINCPGEEPARICTNRATLARVNLFFWDLDKKPEATIIEPTGVTIDGASMSDSDLCQPSDAKLIIDAVEAHPEFECFIVHCTAGISRSSAVGAAIHKIFNGSDDVIYKNPRYRPNSRVYRMVLDEWFSRHPLE